MKVDMNKLIKLFKSPKPVLQKEDADYGYRAMYDAMQVNPLYSYFTQEDIDRIREVALSADINANPAEKYRRLRAIMEPRGFYFIGGGTNRRAYACRYDPRVVAKVATDSVGISNNKRELVNQNVLKPYCSKIFEVSPCGTLAIIERVNPIKTQAEFQTIANEVFDVLEFKIRGNNIGMEDIGRRSFKNWGVRTGYGPVLLDYPTMYVIDKKRAFCCARTKSGDYCNGPLQYDDGFDNIVCSYCGAKYMSKSIAKTDGDKISELLYSASGYKDYNCLNKKGNDGIMKMKLHDLDTGVIREFDLEKNTCKYINTNIKQQDNSESTSNSNKDKPLKVIFKDLDKEEEKKQSEPKVPDTSPKEDSKESKKKAKNAADRLAKSLDDLTKTDSNEESVIYTFLNYMLNTFHPEESNMDWLDMNYELCRNINNYMEFMTTLINYLKKVREYSKLEDYSNKDDGDIFVYAPVIDSIDVVTNIIHDLGLSISNKSCTNADIDIIKVYFEKSNKKYITQAHCYNDKTQEDKLLTYADVILQSIENGVIKQTVISAESSNDNKEDEVENDSNNESEETPSIQVQEEQPQPEPEVEVVEEEPDEEDDEDINMSDIDIDSISVLIPYSGGQKVARANLSEFAQLLCDTAPIKAAEFLAKNIELVCAFRDYITTEKADELLIEENIDLSSMTKHSFVPPTLEEKSDDTKSEKPKKSKSKKVSKNFNNIAPPKQDSDLSKF